MISPSMNIIWGYYGLVVITLPLSEHYKPDQVVNSQTTVRPYSFCYIGTYTFVRLRDELTL